MIISRSVLQIDRSRAHAAHMTTTNDNRGNGRSHDHRVWLVTGCSAGFGRALTEAALDAGDTVVATARRPETLDTITAGDGDGVLYPLALDVTDPQAIERAAQSTIDRFGRIDVLVNNAGHGSVGAV